jgi:hypothetical protein
MHLKILAADEGCRLFTLRPLSHKTSVGAGRHIRKNKFLAMFKESLEYKSAQKC